MRKQCLKFLWKVNGKEEIENHNEHSGKDQKMKFFNHITLLKYEQVQKDQIQLVLLYTISCVIS